MNLKEADAIVRECDPTDSDHCDCLACPVGERLILGVSDAGVDLTGSICSFVQMLQDLIEEQTPEKGESMSKLRQRSDEIERQIGYKCPNRNCPYSGCQHYFLHKEVRYHSVSWCNSTCHKPVEDCPACEEVEGGR